MEDKQLLVYEPPKVITYTEDEILEELGPAQADASGAVDTGGVKK